LPRFQIVLILICVCMHTYFQAKLNSKSSNILSDGSLTDILRSAVYRLRYIGLFCLLTS
jgi:hypothetical protein